MILNEWEQHLFEILIQGLFSLYCSHYDILQNQILYHLGKETSSSERNLWRAERPLLVNSFLSFSTLGTEKTSFCYFCLKDANKNS